jgi:hypothetical protein
MSWHSNELRVIANILEDYEGVNDKSDNLRMAAAGMESMEAQIERLTAEVERLTPKPMTVAEAAKVMRDHAYDGVTDWAVSESTSGGRGVYSGWRGHHRGQQAVYIAQGLLRAAGPIIVQEPATPKEVKP